MKANYLMAIAIVISGAGAAQTNGTVKATQSADANAKAEVHKAGQTAQSNANVSAKSSTAAHVKTDAVKKTRARTKKEGKAAFATVAEKNNELQAEATNAKRIVQQEATVSGKSNTSVNKQKVAADLTSASQVKTEAVQATESNISKEGKTVVNSTFETKKNVGAEFKGAVTEIKQGVSGSADNSASVKAGKTVKVDASSSQRAKVKPSSIGVKTRITSKSDLNLR